MDNLIGFAAALGSIGTGVALWAINRQMNLERRMWEMDKRHQVEKALFEALVSTWGGRVDEARASADRALCEANAIRQLCELAPGTYTEQTDPVTKRKRYVQAGDEAAEREMFLNNQGDALDLIDKALEQYTRA